uniref:Uncharacterized protein n=1 Tax=Mycena chlorophos TaxID=658473 RepID=A0ABQ0LEL0_MYCCL|nr:predicted protein [Mycena chlorophos]
MNCAGLGVGATCFCRSPTEASSSGSRITPNAKPGDDYAAIAPFSLRERFSNLINAIQKPLVVNLQSPQKPATTRQLGERSRDMISLRPMSARAREITIMITSVSQRRGLRLSSTDDHHTLSFLSFTMRQSRPPPRRPRSPVSMYVAFDSLPSPPPPKPLIKLERKKSSSSGGSGSRSGKSGSGADGDVKGKGKARDEEGGSVASTSPVRETAPVSRASSFLRRSIAIPNPLGRRPSSSSSLVSPSRSTRYGYPDALPSPTSASRPSTSDSALEKPLPPTPAHPSPPSPVAGPSRHPHSQSNSLTAPTHASSYTPAGQWASRSLRRPATPSFDADEVVTRDVVPFDLVVRPQARRRRRKVLPVDLQSIESGDSEDGHARGRERDELEEIAFAERDPESPVSERMPWRKRDWILGETGDADEELPEMTFAAPEEGAPSSRASMTTRDDGEGSDDDNGEAHDTDSDDTELDDDDIVFAFPPPDEDEDILGPLPPSNLRGQRSFASISTIAFLDPGLDEEELATNGSAVSILHPRPRAPHRRNGASRPASTLLFAALEAQASATRMQTHRSSFFTASGESDTESLRPPRHRMPVELSLWGGLLGGSDSSDLDCDEGEHEDHDVGSLTDIDSPNPGRERDGERRDEWYLTPKSSSQFSTFSGTSTGFVPDESAPPVPPLPGPLARRGVALELDTLIGVKSQLVRVTARQLSAHSRTPSLAPSTTSSVGVPTPTIVLRAETDGALDGEEVPRIIGEWKLNLEGGIEEVVERLRASGVLVADSRTLEEDE